MGEVEDDWLGRVDEMPGNLYSVAAFGELAWDQIVKGDTLGERIKNAARFFGMLLIALIQILVPPGLFFGSFGFGTLDEKAIKWENWEADMSDWSQIWLTKSMATGFTLVFCLNALFVLIEMRDSWHKVDEMFDYLQDRTPDVNLSGEKYLFAGALINCWVVVWCCLDTVIIMGSSRRPGDVIFDALGLLFLYNLDDISGDLGFVDGDDFPGEKLGWVYENMVKTRWNPPQSLEDLGESEAAVEEVESVDVEDVLDFASKVMLMVWNVTIGITAILTIVLPVFQIITPFLKITVDD